ncbi:MAG: HAMP domain-containing histidine kinase [Planctomycetota bacterium]|nr:HAMP domain-containing histidine kinase [Planctomycetota bacterium]
MARPQPEPDGALEAEALRKLTAKLARLSGDALPDLAAARPSELLARLDRLASACEQKFGSQSPQVESLKAEFIRNVSHELRTPLASIEGFAMALLRGMDPKPARNGEELPREMQRRFLEIINQEARRLSELIEDVLDLSEIESHPQNEDRTEFSAEEVFADAVATFRSRWGAEPARQIRLTLEPRAPGPTVYANRNAVEEMLRHLLDNAKKFSGGKAIELGAAPWGEENGRAWSRIWVSDAGIGIPAVEKSRVFRKFHRLDSAAHTLPGTGLGLTIVKTLVDQNDGRINLESELGAGATFTITLPSHPPKS